MTNVESYTTFAVNVEQQKINIDEVVRLILASRPTIHTIQINNKTKHCSVKIAMNSGTMIVIIENPDDEIFKLEEPSSAETHSI